MSGHIVSRLLPLDEERTRWVVECDLTYRTRLRRMFSVLTTSELRRRMVDGMTRFQRLVENQ